MRARRLTILASLAMVAPLVVAAPAYAVPQSFEGTTVDVIAQPSGDALLGSTAYVPASGGALITTLAATLADAVEVSLIVAASTLDSCTILAGDLDCTMSSTGLSAGPHAVIVRFDSGVTTADFSGTLFVVTSTSPTFLIEWRDASGAWVDGSGTSTPLFGTTAFRCVITNNSNAPIELGSVFAVIDSSPLTTVVPLTSTLQPGETGRYVVWSGLATDAGAASCSGGVSLRDGTGSGGGNGGSPVGVNGTITVTPAPAPGRTVTVAGDAIDPPIVTEFAILVDGAPVAGSPVVITGPDFDFALDVPIPSDLAPGTHTVSVVATYLGRQIVFAEFVFEVDAPALADTGAAEAPLAAIALGLLLVGSTLMLGRHARRPNRLRA